MITNSRGHSYRRRAHVLAGLLLDNFSSFSLFVRKCGRNSAARDGQHI